MQRTKIIILCGTVLLIDLVYVLFRNANGMSWDALTAMSEDHVVRTDEHSSLVSLSSTTLNEQRLPTITVPVDMILFMHIAKTGGTTIRQHVKSFPNVEYQMVTNPLQLNKALERVENRWENYPIGHDGTVVLELHTARRHQSLGLVHFYERLKSMRRKTDRSIFVMTLVREPISFYKSYFSFFHRKSCRFIWCEKERFEEMTDENLIKVAKKDHQCKILFGPLDDDRYMRDFDGFLTKLEETFNWIGTTDDISYSTVPLLTAILSNSTGGFRPNDRKSNAGGSAAVQLKNARTVSILQERSKYDRMLYDWARKTYTLPEE